MKLIVKVISVSFYNYVIKFRVTNKNDSDIYECHFMNSDHHDFINSYQTDFFVVKTKDKSFYRIGKLSLEEVASIWNQIEDAYSKILGQEITID